MENIHQVLIIGAGVSGLAASYTLTQNAISHIILESRDRIGGRIFADKLDGEAIEHGATFVHYPHEEGHVIYALMKQLGVTHYSANYDRQYFWLQGGKIMTESEKDKLYTIYDETVENIKKAAAELDKDINLQQLANRMCQNQTNIQCEQQRRALNWLIEQYANVQGGQLELLSAKEAQFKSMRQDVIPITGYFRLLQLFVQQFNPCIVYNQRVTQIDYSQQIITITTQNSTYKTRKVISSLPLGVLQSNLIKFKPQLPLQYTQAIESIGVAVFNKLFVSFEQPFWGNKQGWLHFVSKTGKCKYPEVLILPTASKPILCVQISVETSKSLGKLGDKQIIEDFYAFLKGYVDEKNIKIKDFKLTRWHLDRNSLGCYSYAKVGGSTTQRNTLAQPIRDALWFIGEHTNAENYATVHGAYETGVSAANQIVKLLKMM